MRYDIMMMWSNESPPGYGIFEDLRAAGAQDILRNGTAKTGGKVFFTTYATVTSSAGQGRQLAARLETKYKLEALEVTWNPPDALWAIGNWCLEHNFQTGVDAFQGLIEYVSKRAFPRYA